MVRQRGRTDLQTEKAIEEFAAQAEKPLAPVTALPQAATAAALPQETEPAASLQEVEPEAPKTTRAKAPAAGTTSKASKPSAKDRILAPAMEDWKRRNREPKSGGINFRASASQLDLLRTAALVEEISQQKILERLVWPILEEKYGASLSE